MNDPRYYQLLIQLFLLSWGFFFLDFINPFYYLALLLIITLLTQFLFTSFYALPFNALSTINSSLSIVILLHATHWIWIALAGVIAISSKFILRFQNNHLFNPSNIGIVLVLLITDNAWVASGQWGQTLWIILFIAGIGLVFLMGLSQMLTSISFLITFALLLMLRTFWLGDPWVIPLHQLQNGTLLIFTFFMLSDPKTTPHCAQGRIIFGGFIAILSWLLQTIFYIPNAFLYALMFSMPLVYLLNQIFQGQNYQWLSMRKKLL